MSTQHRFTFRLDKTTWRKLRYIANQNFRTVNKELEMLINKYLEEYEDAHGVILIEGVEESCDEKDADNFQI